MTKTEGPNNLVHLAQKRCSACLWLVRSTATTKLYCDQPGLVSEANRYRIPCDELRAPGGLCGRDAHYFEPLTIAAPTTP